MNNFDFALGTHTGWVRELNEDSHLFLPKLGLWVIADGMGGYEAGEVASRITILEIARSIEQGMPPAGHRNSPPCDTNRRSERRGNRKYGFDLGRGETGWSAL